MVAQLETHLVDVTPVPTLPRLVRADDRMAGGIEMCRGVSLRRLVATTDVATGLTSAKVNPGVLSGGQAIVTSLGLGDGVGYGVDVIADFQVPGSFVFVAGRLNARAGFSNDGGESPPTAISGIIRFVSRGREKNFGFRVWSTAEGGIKQPSVPGVGASASTPGTVFFYSVVLPGAEKIAKTNLSFRFPIPASLAIKLSSVPGVETSVSTPGTVFLGGRGK